MAPLTLKVLKMCIILHSLSDEHPRQAEVVGDSDVPIFKDRPVSFECLSIHSRRISSNEPL